MHAETSSGTAPDRAFPATQLGDLRFRALLSSDDWPALPLPVRRRFSKRLAEGRTALYVGEIVHLETSRIGRVLAGTARLIGAPLPLHRDIAVPSIVAVTEDMATGGQIWTRIYTRRNGFPQVIHSSKRFAGPTGLEEYVGFGIGMALAVRVVESALEFCSAFYFVQVLGRRVVLPGWLTPGTLRVRHTELGEGRFRFTLEVVHPKFGLLIRQVADYRDER